MSRHNPEVQGPLDNPHVDTLINQGTTVANCQPRHTRSELDQASVSDDSTYSSTSNGKESMTKEEKKQMKKDAKTAKKKRDSEDPKKMGYIQMAKMGYQELVNAIIRPPRADYKVRLIHKILLFILKL